jgi:signal transduction histidine kinase
VPPTVVAMRPLRIASWAIEPLTAVVFVLLWVNAEIGRGVTGLVGMIGFGLAVALSGRVPFVAFGAMGATLLLQCFGVGRFGSTDWPADLAILLVVGFAVAHGRIPKVWVPLILGAMADIIATALMVFSRDGWNSWTASWPTWGPTPQITSFLFLASLSLVGVALFWGSGWGVRALAQLTVAAETQERIEVRLADSEVQLAVAEERNRIAQEMHDVLAHSLAVVIAQADGARYLRAKRPAAVDSALMSISDAARSALVDVSGIIDGVLDGKPAPQPELADLDELISTVATTGLRIQLTHAGEAQPLAPGQQLAVYRIVQEGLTNALRHRGRDSEVTIVLDWRGPGLALQLLSSGGQLTEALSEPARIGRGVAGMMERARISGGWAAAGPDENGDHRVTAFIPYREADRLLSGRPRAAA